MISLLGLSFRCISKIIKFILLKKLADLLFDKKRESKYIYTLLIILIILELLFIQNKKYYYLVKILFSINWILFIKVNYKVDYFKSISCYIIYDMIYYISFDILLGVVYFIVTGKLITRTITSERNIDLIFIYSNTIIIIINFIYVYILKCLLKIDNDKRNIIYIIYCILVNSLITIMNHIPIYGRAGFNIDKEVLQFNYDSAPKLTILSNILLLVVIIQIIKDSKIKADNKIIKEKLELQYNYYLNIQESQMKVKKLYHDINNHMICIKNVYNQNKQVDKYIENIDEEINDFQNTFNTRNMILDIILNEKKDLCEKNKIDLFCDINFERCNFIEMIDVCSIFSNIIDNAIEACINIDNKSIPRYINIRGTIIKSYYVIKCENIKSNEVKIKSNKIFTSKKDKFLHGMGLESVKSSLKKYDGEFEINNIGNKFIIKIYIPLQ